MTTHAQFAPSKAATWAHCKGALALALANGVKDGAPSEYAASGTLTHLISAAIFDGSASDAYPLGSTHEVDGFKFTVDEERIARAESYTGRVRVEAEGGMLFVEHPLRLTDTIYGTGDAIVARLSERELQVHDLKDGTGPVLAEDNEQLITYLCAARREFGLLGEFTVFTGWIHQPKLDYVGRVSYMAEELDRHEARLKQAAADGLYLIKKGTPQQIRLALQPSDKACKWCPMRGACPALSEKMAAEFPDLTAERSTLSDEELGGLLARRRQIDDYFNGIFAEALNRARLGSTIKGWKLAQGRAGNRKWSNEQFVERLLNAALAGDAYERKLINPTQAQKKLKARPDVWSELESSVTRPEGQVTLVPEADGRSPIAANVEEFEVVQTGIDLL